MFGAAHASHKSQMGRNRRTDPAESSVLCPWAGRASSLRSVVLLAGTCSVPALLLGSRAGLQESLRCFFCSWYSVIFCWKYAVDEKRSSEKCKRSGWGGYRAAQPESWRVRLQPGSQTVLGYGQPHPGEDPGKIGVVAIPPIPLTSPKWALLCWVSVSF